ncbi:MAG: RNAse [Chloroflexi bacterium]|nr:RNAse [Chloroflexota bacterium]
MVTGSDRFANLDNVGLPDARQRVEAMEAILGFAFDDRTLLLQALLHRSAVLERQRDGVAAPSLPSNERLEFLGDAVLSMLVAHYAFAHFPEYGEGMLTEVRAALVRRSTLAILAEAIGLGPLMYMGRGERRIGGRGRMTVLAEGFEAVVAAIYLDQGLERTRDFVMSLLEQRITMLLERAGTLNAKSRLQQLAQTQLRVLPAYTLIQRSGPAHDSKFTVEVRAGEFSEVGQGTSKQGAEQRAAQALLLVLEPIIASRSSEGEPESSQGGESHAP